MGITETKIRDYEILYRELGIKIPQLKENYSPELFGRELMSGMVYNTDVVYSASTSFSLSDTNSKEQKEVVY